MSSTCPLLIELWKLFAFILHLSLNSAYYASRYILHFKWECMDLCQKRHDELETNLKYGNEQSQIACKSYKFGWCWISYAQYQLTKQANSMIFNESIHLWCRCLAWRDHMPYLWTTLQALRSTADLLWLLLWDQMNPLLVVTLASTVIHFLGSSDVHLVFLTLLIVRYA